MVSFPRREKMMRFILAVAAFWMVVCSNNVMAMGFVKTGEQPTCHPLGRIEAGMVYDPIEFKESDGQIMQFQEDKENKVFTIWHNGEVIKKYSDLHVPVVKQIKDNDTGRNFYILYYTLTVSTKKSAHIIIGYDQAKGECVEYLNTLDYFKPSQGYDSVACYIGSPDRFILCAHQLCDGDIEGYQLTWDEKVHDFRKEPFEIDERKTIQAALDNTKLTTEPLNQRWKVVKP